MWTQLKENILLYWTRDHRGHLGDTHMVSRRALTSDHRGSGPQDLFSPPCLSLDSLKLSQRRQQQWRQQHQQLCRLERQWQLLPWTAPLNPIYSLCRTRNQREETQYVRVKISLEVSRIDSNPGLLHHSLLILCHLFRLKNSDPGAGLKIQAILFPEQYNVCGITWAKNYLGISPSKSLRTLGLPCDSEIGVVPNSW